MKIRSVRLRYIVTGGMLFLASWLGYWLGFVIHHTGTDKHDLSVQGYPLKDANMLEIKLKSDENHGEINNVAYQESKAKDKVDMQPDNLGDLFCHLFSRIRSFMILNINMILFTQYDVL